MRGCELIWGAVKADEVQAMVQRALGTRCPCERDERCPLLGNRMPGGPVPPEGTR